jgi:PleD family two-component response regulator
VAEAEIGDNEDSLLRRADLALYQVKQGGRNGVSVAAKKTANVERA